MYTVYILTTIIFMACLNITRPFIGIGHAMFL
jgi:hypothetical protein